MTDATTGRPGSSYACATAGFLAIVVAWCAWRVPAAVTHLGDGIGEVPVEQGSWAGGALGWLGVLIVLRGGGAAVGLALVAAMPVTAWLLVVWHAERTSTAHLVEEVLLGTAPQLCVLAVHRMRERSAARRPHESPGRELRPLLDGIATGRLDPGDPEVRRRCAVAAARVRRAFAETDQVEAPLLHELRACADVAERRRVAVDLEVLGDLPEIPRPVRRALTEAPLVALADARTHARVVVVADERGVAVSVVADATRPVSPSSPTDQVTTVHQWEGEDLWIHTRWTRPSTSRSSRTIRS
ncbi:hypothetical protein [Streptomyces hainanensis]|uniref:ATP-binding protein n=1 Tax=Streptomyces hainanensis TaxID=402648 RepID=A0A4R4TB44_9ACTN|nr:hypothetical protein [Streptomyces hainanensis]TDC74551.1 hypothetical protein E1283_15295 [Streptomyces hainanensis]